MKILGGGGKSSFPTPLYETLQFEGGNYLLAGDEFRMYGKSILEFRVLNKIE